MLFNLHGRWASPRFDFLSFRLCGPLPLCDLCVSLLRNQYGLFAIGQIVIAISRATVNGIHIT